MTRPRAWFAILRECTAVAALAQAPRAETEQGWDLNRGLWHSGIPSKSSPFPGHLPPNPSSLWGLGTLLVQSLRRVNQNTFHLGVKCSGRWVSWDFFSPCRRGSSEVGDSALLPGNLVIAFAGLSSSLINTDWEGRGVWGEFCPVLELWDSQDVYCSEGSLFIGR